MMINVLEKLMPAAAKLGTKAVLEIIGVASLGAGVVNFALDKGTDFAKGKIDTYCENKKEELMKKKAALEAAKESVVVVTEEIPAEEVKPVEEKKPANTSKKKK